MSERDRTVPPRPPMRDTEAYGEDLAEVAEEARDMLASYVVGCDRLQEIEATEADAGAVEDAERRLVDSRRQLSAALLRLASIPAHTTEGALARLGTAREYFGEFPVEDAGGMALLRVIFADVDRLHGRGRELPPDA